MSQHSQQLWQVACRMWHVVFTITRSEGYTRKDRQGSRKTQTTMTSKKTFLASAYYSTLRFPLRKILHTSREMKK
jgi:hypothetical protein